MVAKVRPLRPRRDWCTTFTVEDTQVFTAEGPITASHTYPQSGRYIVGLRVKDRDGGTSAIRTLVVNVANVAPAAVAPTAAPSATSEGQSVRLAASFSDVENQFHGRMPQSRNNA